MKKYELLLVLPGTLDEKEAEVRSQEIISLVKENASNLESQSIGKNRLAYPIKQIRYGYFYTVTFTADTGKLKIIQDKLVLMRDVLRALISHFNTELTAAQKIAYSATDSAGATAPAIVKEEVVKEKEVKVEAVEKAVEVEAPAPTVATKKAEKLNLDEINKKLDDLMKGDVLPGV